MAKLWSDGAGWERDKTVQPHEDHMLRLDSSKARLKLGWTPVLSLSSALEWVVEWYRAYQHGKDLRALTLDQIVRYEDLLEKQSKLRIETRLHPVQGA
jgi:CDP-glucose 4,6-dehydratase